MLGSKHGGAIAHVEASREAVRRLANDPLRHTVGVLVMALMLALPGVAWVALRPWMSCCRLKRQHRVFQFL